jgi:DivIVA domain-containing protein
MATMLLALVVVLVIAALVFGVVTLLSGDDPGLSTVEPDGRALPLPNNRSLTEFDLKTVRFDVEVRGYRMAQVDRVLRRTAYDVGYKDEMIAVLEAEVAALREGRLEDAELLRKARESAAGPATDTAGGAHPGVDQRLGPDAEEQTVADALDDEPSAADVDPTTDPAPNTRADQDTDRDLETDTQHHEETEERLDQDGRPAVTEDPGREPTGDPDAPEERAAHG